MSVLLKYSLVFAWCLLSHPLWAQQYDLLIKGGTVIDPKNNIFEPLDIAILEGKIQEVSSQIDPQTARQVLDARGLIVTPGLIDIHTHVFVGGREGIFAGGFYSVSPDDFSFRTGITTMVDAGTSGWRSFPEFKTKIIDASQTRILAFLNITGAGMIGKPGEEELSDMEIEATLNLIKQYPQTIVGAKIGHYTGESWEPFDKALDVARQANKPLFLECHLPQLPLDELLDKMRPGDIFTHTYGAVDDRLWLLDANGQVLPSVRNAREKGIFFDVGHGGGSFHFKLAQPAVQQNFYPHSMGTDLHRFSMNAGMKNMLNIMSKFLNMGMDLPAVIEAATWNPARMILREDLGQLGIGSEADVALIRVRSGEFGFVDAGGYKITGDKLLQSELTIKGGKVVWDLNGLAAKQFKN